jgi:hypothetical protein
MESPEKQGENAPVTQGIPTPSEPTVGYKKPPAKNRWPKGVSGNPRGSKRGETHLWRYICTYMSMPMEQLALLDPTQLTAAQAGALKIVKGFGEGKAAETMRLAEYAVDREQGRAVETVHVESDTELTAVECRRIRTQLAEHFGGTDAAHE